MSKETKPTPEQSPGTWKEISEKLTLPIKKWFLGLHWSAKIALIIVLPLTIARLGYGGEKSYHYSKLLIPCHITFIDGDRVAVPLIFSFTVEDDMGKRNGKLGATYYSGDRIDLSFSVGVASWLTVFCVDSKGIHKVFPKTSFDPLKVEKGHPYATSFSLDETVGTEIYYAIASDRQFNFQKDIEPKLKTLFPTGSAKGPVFSAYALKLSDDFTQQFIYFNHHSRQNEAAKPEAKQK